MIIISLLSQRPECLDWIISEPRTRSLCKVRTSTNSDHTDFTTHSRDLPPKRRITPPRSRLSPLSQLPRLLSITPRIYTRALGQRSEILRIVLKAIDSYGEHPHAALVFCRVGRYPKHSICGLRCSLSSALHSFAAHGCC